MQEDWENDADEDWDDNEFDEDSADDLFACPECSADVHVDAEACPACGYWITDADRTDAWRAGSASGRIIMIGLCLIGAAAAVAAFLAFR